jgi:NAD(P)-dependent dehydrogenase (short-subunit alcohol dehydrogenase family)
MKQVVLVTGGSRGIGLSTAIALAKDNFSIAINSLADDQELSKAVAHIQDLGVEAMGITFDVTDIGAHLQALKAVEAKLGPLTTLVNNAGVGVMSRGDPLDVTEESYDRCLAVNAKAVFFLTQQFSKLLLQRARPPELFHSVVNITSVNAVAVAEPRAEYCASKAAASMISKTFAVRLGRENIAVFDVQPGLIATQMTASVIDSYAKRASEGLTVVPRVGQPEEVGRVVASLAAGRLPYVTGQSVAVDGGLLIPRF